MCRVSGRPKTGKTWNEVNGTQLIMSQCAKQPPQRITHRTPLTCQPPSLSFAVASRTLKVAALME